MRVCGCVAAVALALLCGRSAVASEREWQPSVAGTVGFAKTSAFVARGLGVEVATAYGLEDFLDVEARIGCLYFADVGQDAVYGSRTETLLFDATRCSLLPMLRLKPSPRFWSEKLGDILTPSIGVGLGYGLEYQTPRTRAFRGFVMGKLDDLWSHELQAATSVSLDMRPWQWLGAGVYGRFATPVGRSFWAARDVTLGLFANVFLYP